MFRLLLNLSIFILYLECQKPQNILSDPILCQDQKNCGSCMNASTVCRWCLKPDFEPRRCNIESYLLKQGCESKYIINVKTRYELSRPKQTEYYSIDHRLVSAYFRPMESIEFDIEFTLNDLLPIELAVLLHYSKTLAPNLNKIIDLTQEISKIQDNRGLSKVGYTKFLDKVSHPIIDIGAYDFLNNNAMNPFNFEIIYPLSTNSTNIVNILRNTAFSMNFDKMEAILDGIVQTVQCFQMDWKPGNEVIKIVLAITDDLPKIQGHGKIVGVIRPHDLECHVDDRKKDEFGMIYDYPSVGQTGFVLEDNHVEIIFMLNQKIKPFYQKMIESWPKVKATLIDFDISNEEIISLILQSQENLKKELKIYSINTEDVSVKILAMCPDSFENICYNISLKTPNKFNFKIQSLQYINDTREISLWFSRFDHITVKYERIKTCECSNTNLTQNECKNNGSLSCGKCLCQGNWGGKDCSCNKNLVNFYTACKNPQTFVLCNGRGTCDECGKCQCYTAPDGYPFEGDLCECSRKSCGYLDGKICGGDSRGSCKCNTCECKDRYTGYACEIEKCDVPDTKNLCIQPDSDKACSGVGPCKCGKCICPLNREGEYCEKEIQRIDCDYFENAVFCFTEGIDEKPESCQSENITIITKESDQYSCFRSNNANCRTYYNYELNKQSGIHEVFVKPIDKKSDCVKPVNVALIAILSFFAVIAFGFIIIVIYFGMIYFYVRYDYKKYLRELQKQTPENLNPLYNKQK